MSDFNDSDRFSFAMTIKKSVKFCFVVTQQVPSICSVYYLNYYQRYFIESHRGIVTFDYPVINSEKKELHLNKFDWLYIPWNPPSDYLAVEFHSK